MQMLPRQPILDSLAIGQTRFWLFDVSGSSPATASLWATDESNNVFWSANKDDELEQYVSISVVEELLYANTFSGWRHHIDVNTGSVLERWFTK